VSNRVDELRFLWEETEHTMAVNKVRLWLHLNAVGRKQVMTEMVCGDKVLDILHTVAENEGLQGIFALLQNRPETVMAATRAMR